MKKKLIKKNNGAYRYKKEMEVDDYIFCFVIVFTVLFFTFQLVRGFFGL